MNSIFRKLAALVLCLPLPLPLLAAGGMKVDAGKSTVSAVFKQMNVPLEARFKKFTALIEFASAQPSASNASLEIDISSFDMGDSEYNKEVLKKEWFNSAQFPKATFVSTSIKALAGGKFDVSGKLGIKGKSIDMVFPLTVKTEGVNQIIDGVLPIKRLAFNIGDGEWKDTSIVADEVLIKFHIVAAP